MSAPMHIAQVNIARIKHENIDAPEMFTFVTKLAPINTLAERAPGFVWRLADEDGDGATGIEVFPEDPNVIMNMSVWETMEDMFDFAYKTVHAKVMKRRAEWFIPVEGIANLALWWVEAGHIPTVAEATARMRALHANGPTPEAFTFDLAFDPSGKPVLRDWPKKDCA
ncbi:MAG: DUF3291 domain-containing protein [Pseudomonadota bacterium]